MNERRRNAMERLKEKERRQKKAAASDAPAISNEAKEMVEFADGLKSKIALVIDNNARRLYLNILKDFHRYVQSGKFDKAKALINDLQGKVRDKMK